MHRLAGVCLTGLLAFALSGCGGPAPSSKSAPAQPVLNSNQELKERLNYIANSGVTGSALGGMPEIIKKSGKPELEKDYAELEKAQSPDQIKSIAKRMADKL